MLGTLIGRRAWYFYGKPLFPNFFVVLVGETAKTKKTTAMRYALDFLENFVGRRGQNGIRILPGVSTSEGLLKALGGFTPGIEEEREGLRLLLAIEEFAILLRKARQESTSTLPPYLTFLYDTPSRAELPTKKSPLMVSNPYLNLLAGTTPDWLESSVKEEEVMGGFLNRFIFITGKPKGSIPVPQKPDPALQSEILSFLQELDQELKPHEYRLSRTAEKFWIEFYKKWNKEVRPGILPALLERIPEYALKTAMIYAVLKKRSVIGDDDVQKGVLFARFAEQSAWEIFAAFSLSFWGKTEAKILQLLEEQNPRTRSEIHQKISGRVSADVLERIIKGLISSDRIEQYRGKDRRLWLRKIGEEPYVKNLPKSVGK